MNMTWAKSCDSVRFNTAVSANSGTAATLVGAEVSSSGSASHCHAQRQPPESSMREAQGRCLRKSTIGRVRVLWNYCYHKCMSE